MRTLLWTMMGCVMWIGCGPANDAQTDDGAVALDADGQQPGDISLDGGQADGDRTDPGPQVAIQARVLDSLGGSPLADVGVYLTDPDSPAWPLDRQVTDADGLTDEFLISVAPNRRYLLVTDTGRQRAIASVQNVHAGENRAVYQLYCHDIGMFPDKAHEPVLIEKIETSSDRDDWKTLADGQRLALDQLRHVRVTASGTAAIMPTSWSGYGIAMQFGHAANFMDRILPAEYEQMAEEDGPRFRSTARFDLVDMPVTPAQGLDHIQFVAYDVANNRAELTLSGVIADPPSVPETVALPAPELNTEFGTYGVSTAAFWVHPDDVSIPTSHYVLHRIKAGQPIRGAVLYRAEGEQPGTADYRVVIHKRYASLKELEEGETLSIWEYDDAMRADTTYHYRLVVYDDSNRSETSAVTHGHFLPAFHLRLTGPEDGARLDDLTPEYRFEVTNYEHLLPLCDTFYFMLVARQKTGYRIDRNYQLDLATDTAFNYDREASEVSHTAGVFSIQGFDSLQAGAAYEWDVFGKYFQTAPEFRKNFGDNAMARSFGNNAYEGNDALNGCFTFSLAADASDR